MTIPAAFFAMVSTLITLFSHYSFLMAVVVLRVQGSFCGVCGVVPFICLFSGIVRGGPRSFLVTSLAWGLPFSVTWDDCEGSSCEVVA